VSLEALSFLWGETMTTVEELVREIEELRERHEKAEQKRIEQRIARGQRPEPPEPFVDPVLSAVLAERIQPVVKYGLAIAEMFANGYKLPIDMSQFDKYRIDIDLLKMSVVPRYKSEARTADHVLKILSEYTANEINNKTVARGIANLFRLDDMREKVRESRIRRGKLQPYESDEELTELEALAKQLVSDDDRFQALYSDTIKRYKEIESELDEPIYNKLW